MNILPYYASDVLAERSTGYIAASVAENTRKGYAADLRTYSEWCAATNCRAFPASPFTLAAYFTHLADSGKKVSTIKRAKAALRMAHDAAGYDDPTNERYVRQTLAGIVRTLGSRAEKKAPALTNDIRAMLSTFDYDKPGLRNRAILLIGYAGAFRRSELADMCMEHIEETQEGIKILLPKSKTDQEGIGRYVGIVRGEHPATCPVRALKRWLDAACICEGRVFRRIDRNGYPGKSITSTAIARIVKDAAGNAGLDARKYSGHSLRAGCVTQGAKAGASVATIMRQTGHTSYDTVEGYIRVANIFQDNVSSYLGL